MRAMLSMFQGPEKSGSFFFDDNALVWSIMRGAKSRFAEGEFHAQCRSTAVRFKFSSIVMRIGLD
jgi:hypothetical protein